MTSKPREHHNWCDFTEEEKVEYYRWFCNECDFGICESYGYCPSCGVKLDWGD